MPRLRPRRLVLVATLASTLVALSGYAAASTLPPQDVAVVTVSNAAGGPVIQPGFLGLSLENSAIIPYAGTDPERPDPVFLQLVRNLTPDQSPELRIGGDSTDWAWYPVPGLTKPKGVRVTLTPRWIGVMHAIAADLNARLIMGVDLEADSRAAADGEASAFERGIGKPWIEALELGNEPNLYGSLVWYVAPDGTRVTGRPPGYDFSSYLGEYSAFAKGLPGPLAGPATGSPTWMPDTGAFLAAEPRVGVATLHAYPLQTCDLPPSSPIYPTLAHLFAPAATTGLADGVAPVRPGRPRPPRSAPDRRDEHRFVRRRARRQQRVRLGAVGARRAVRDGPGRRRRREHPHLSRSHLPAVHVHEFAPRVECVRGPGVLRPRHVRPGRPAADRAWCPPRSRTLRGSWSGPRAGEQGHTRVVLINESLDRRTVAVPSAGAHPVPAALELLRAPRLTSTSGVTLGGQSFGTRTTTGRLAGRSGVAKLTPSHGQYEFTLPAESAALVTLP